MRSLTKRAAAIDSDTIACINASDSRFNKTFDSGFGRLVDSDTTRRLSPIATFNLHQSCGNAADADAAIFKQ